MESLQSSKEENIYIHRISHLTQKHISVHTRDKMGMAAHQKQESQQYCSSPESFNTIAQKPLAISELKCLLKINKYKKKKSPPPQMIEAKNQLNHLIKDASQWLGHTEPALAAC